MCAFFHGWRRKAGVVTLVILQALAIIWVRSFICADIISVGADPWFVTIGGGQCALMLGPIGPFNFPAASWDVIEYNVHTFNELPSWQRRGIYSVPLGQSLDPEMVLTLQLSWIILFFAILSAYLILWTPRKWMNRDA
ncbi:MAG: hypothetical protein JWP89_2761 [Schlesneria sp.]|nr:hypothetical protein [Schlesneria sp.]